MLEYADPPDLRHCEEHVFDPAAARRFLHRYTAAVVDSFTKMQSSRLRFLDLELQRGPKPHNHNITRLLGKYFTCVGNGGEYGDRQTIAKPT